MRAEYHLDYRKARPNRFSDRLDRNGIVVTLDPDVAEVFQTSEAVNGLLRSVIAAFLPAAGHAAGRGPRRKTG